MNTELIAGLRPTLKNYAYNICGSVEEAEDIVQDVLLKFLSLDQQHIECIQRKRCMLVKVFKD
jgi:DNA-directed RNA polymerase specialized sigma24 family protein